MGGSVRPSSSAQGDPSQSDRQQFGELVIDRAERRVLLGDREVHLTPSEFRLLSTLAAEPQRAFSRRQLLEAMWESQWRSSTAPLQIHVSRLRKKLATAGAERSFLTTIHGYGYRFDPGPEARVGDQPQGDPSAGRSTTYVLVSADRKILWARSNVQDLLGWRPSDLVGKPVDSLVHPDDMVHVLDLQTQLDDGKHTEFLGRVATADGDFRPFKFRIRPITKDHEGDQMFLVEWQEPESTEPEVGTVRLFLDRDLILREVQPHEAFLGFDPDAVIGTFFSPAGLTREQMDTTIRGMIGVGQTMLDSDVIIFDAIGLGRPMRVVSRLLVGAEQEFLGLDSTIYLPATRT